MFNKLLVIFLILVLSVMPASADSRSEIQTMIDAAAERYSMEPVRFRVVEPDHTSCLSETQP